MDSVQNVDARVLLQQWLNGIKIAEIAHRRAAASYKLRGRMLGIPVTIISAVIGTSIFAAINSSNSQQVLIFVGVISVTAAILSGIQTFLNYPELAERNYTAGVKYGKLRRRVEEFMVFPSDREELHNVMIEIQDKWSQLEEESPVISQRAHDKALYFVKPAISEQRGIK